ncbi:DNA helicase [Flexivirga endophytica]|uniref:DNA helicase n=1 Tax=Flexivirga endophytica TaxID=1849103 RepID=A0A916TDM7_9MICO|nr:UvrD-helicase domain-containing protein [Flexivirga endophytica]GGB39625.1 DNA helicase [Flexivirga endophytica]GHB47532.1 DNA helicase [Flexivirga endophytica]
MPGTTTRQADALHQEQETVDDAYLRREELLQEVEQDLEAAPRDAVEAARITSLRRRRSDLRHAESGLVFGRLDATDGTSRHLGRVGLPRADDDSEPLVLDWRAPAARPFYTATPLDPQGQRRRRHIRTEGRRVVGVDDEPLDAGGSEGEELVGEGALLNALSARRTGKMGTAVATLQREQDAIVRADSDGPLVVQGGPGTGKTVVALHRVAYLLFSNPDLASQGVLVLGPSRRFLDYIAQVLPALGETAVVPATCDTLVPGVAVERDESRALAELKGRVSWQDTLTAYAHSLVPAPEALHFLLDGEPHTLPLRQIRRAVDAAVSGRDLHAARRWFVENVHDLLTDAVVEHHDELLARVEEGLEDILERVDASQAKSDDRGVHTGATGGHVDGTLSDHDIEQLRIRIANDRSVAGVLDDFWPLYDARLTLRDLLGDDAALSEFADWLDPDQRALIAGEPAPLASSDIALLDAVSELLGPIAEIDDQGEFLADRAAARRDWAYGHVVVDEAQELSAMQWQMIARRVPSRSITAVGDIDQTEAAHRHTSWEGAIAPVFGERWRRSDLTICYRTPREVMVLTGAVLAKAGSHNEPPRAVRDSGFEPWTVQVRDAELAATVRESVDAMAARWQGGSVGVVAPQARVTALREQLPDVVVLAATEAKGLEWDAALVVDPDGITTEPRGWNGLYVALTRCTQELGQVVLPARR